MSKLTFKAAASMFNTYNKQVTINNDKIIYLTYSPLSNCQISSIGRAYQLFQSFSIEEIKEILSYLKNKHYISNMILVDINQSYKTIFTKKISKNAILFSNDYLNKTGSKMFISLLDVSKI